MTPSQFDLEKLTSCLCMHPVRILLGLLLVTILALGLASQVEKDQSIEVWFLEEDVELKIYEDFTRKFQADEIIVIGVFADNVFDPATWDAIHAIAVAAKDLPFIHRVVTAESIGLIAPVIDEGDPTLREQVLANSLLTGSFVSPAGDSAAVVLQLTREGNTFANKRLVVELLRLLLAERDPLVPMNVRIAGTPVTDDAAMRHNEHDMFLIVPLMILVILGVAFGVFRRFALALIPLGIVLMSASWAFGLMGLLGFRFTLISSALLPLVLAVGVADSVHLITQYHFQRIRRSHDAAIASTVSRLLMPCFFTSATTVAGLMALTISNLAPIREFGLIAAFGVVAAFVVSILGVPAALALLGERLVLSRSGVEEGRLQRFLRLLGPASGKLLPSILIGFSLLVIVFGLLSLRTPVGIDPISWYEDDDPVLLDTLAIDEAFGGSLGVEFLVTTDPGGLQDREILARLDDFERWLEKNTPISRVLSLVDILKEIGRTGLTEEGALPLLPPPSTLRTIFSGLNDRTVEQWVDDEYRSGRLWARIPLTQSAEAIKRMPDIQQQIDLRFKTDELQVQMTGYASLMVKMQQYMLEGQIQSLMLAFVTVALLVGLVLRSWRFSVIAMLTNLIPVIVALGMMPLLGASLNPGTVMVGAIVLGVVVDDTVHFLTAFRRHAASRPAIADALSDTLSEVGVPVVVTSVVLAAGFASLSLGEFVPSQEVGMVTAIVVVVALLADLLLLPAVLRGVPRFAVGGANL